MGLGVLVFLMKQVMTPAEYFPSAKYNQAYIGEMCMHLLMKYKWQTNCTRSSQRKANTFFVIKLDIQMAGAVAKKV